MKYNAAAIRNACQLVDTFKRGGMLFVPLPVLSSEDFDRFNAILAEQITKIEEGQKNEKPD